MSNNFDSLGDRMKSYEDVYKHRLIRRLPVIIRLDGRAFHTLTKDMQKPFDINFSRAMLYVTIELVKEIQGCMFGYTQSDEISLLLKDWTTHTTEAWFDNQIQKMASVSASIATMSFVNYGRNNPEHLKISSGTFDSRVFNLPLAEVNNYFVWRQNDATRNSINALGQSLYSQKELHGVKVGDLKQKILEEKNIVWEELDQWKKMGYGLARTKWPHRLFPGEYETSINLLKLPLFSQDANFIERFLKEGEENNVAN